MQIDYDAAYQSYLARFDAVFPGKPDGSFVKFGRHMVQKLSRAELDERLDNYLSLHSACKKMLTTGATISDALVLDFEEAATWLALEAPNMLAMFSGEIGDPELATGAKQPPPKK